MEPIFEFTLTPLFNYYPVETGKPEAIRPLSLVHLGVNGIPIFE